MPLPDSSVPWPPEDTEQARALFDAWGAWYSGSPEQLARVYGGGGNTAPYGLPPRPRPSTFRGGVVGTVARWFWGNPPNQAQRPTRLHVPLAGDIAAVNADLLFGEAPTLATEETGGTRPVQERLDELMTEGGLHSALLEGAEVCAAYGGVYLRVSWDRDLSPFPIVEPIIPDTAAPEWAGQHLRAVTFWRVLSDEGDSRVVRHLERHEPGRVFHGLYEGGQNALGTKVPLTERPETERFAGAVDAQGGISTGAEGLAVVYVPNMRPHRLIRGTPMGRSDYQGVEPFMDALDEAWSSWMRDIRLAKARLVVPDSFLQNLGRGQGSFFDGEQEVYEGVTGLQGANERFSDMISAHQFAIRVDEHSRTCQELTEQIVRGAGFSAQTFGESRDLAVTATEVTTRERRTYSTRARKIGYWQPALTRLLEVVLQIDRAALGTGITPVRPSLSWPDGVQDSPEQVATTVELLNRARAASTQTLVQIVHPDWDETEVQAEVQRIEEADQPDPRLMAGLVGGAREEEGADGGVQREAEGSSGQRGQGDAGRKVSDQESE